LIKDQGKAIEGIQEEIKTERKRWMDHIYFEGAANYGIYDNLVVNRISNSVDVSTGIITRNEQFRYYGGVSLKLPLSAISSSSSKIKAKRLLKEQAGYKMQQLKEDIKQLIIEQYFQLKYLQESMNTYNKITQTLEISLLKAEKDLINGHMDFDDYGILVSTTGKSKNDYLKAKNSFYAQYNKLESLSGLTFNQQK
jgi:outer membrane protein TolC